MKLSKILPSLIFIIGALFVYNLLSKNDDTNGSSSVREFKMVDVTNLKKDIDAAMKKLLSTLNNIKDEASAKEAVVTLEGINDNLRKYEPLMYRVPTVHRRQIKEYVTDFVPHLRVSLSRLKEIKGVVPILDSILGKLEETLVLYHSL